MSFSRSAFRALPLAALLLLAACGGASSSGGASAALQPRYAYAINFNSTIWTFSEDGAALDLAANQVNSDEGASRLVMDPQRRWLYAVNTGLGGTGIGSVTAYDLTAADHRPVSLGASVATGANTAAVAMAPSGQFLYVGGDAGIYTFRISASGTLSQVGNPVASGSSVTGLAVDSGGRYLYTANGYTPAGSGSSDNTLRVFTLDSSTGTPSDTGHSYATGLDPQTVQVGGAAVYVINRSGNSVSIFLKNADGSLSSKPAATTGAYPVDLVLDPSGRFLYSANRSGNSVSGFRVGADGGLTSLGPDFDVQDGPNALAVDPEGTHVFTANYNNAFTGFSRDGATGQLSYVGKSLMGGEPHAILIR